MPRAKEASKRKSRACAVPLLGAAGLSVSLATGAPAATVGPVLGHEITLGEEEIADVSLATFYVFDKENPQADLQLVGHGGGGAAAVTVTAAEAAAVTAGTATAATATAVAAAAAAGAAAEAASELGSAAAAVEAVEVVQAAIGAGRTAFGSGATIDVAGSPKAGFT